MTASPRSRPIQSPQYRPLRLPWTNRQILAVLAFIKARRRLGPRVSQAMLNPGFAGMPTDADEVEWRVPPNCNVLLWR
jgi:hypothetical protein